MALRFSHLSPPPKKTPTRFRKPDRFLKRTRKLFPSAREVWCRVPRRTSNPSENGIFTVSACRRHTRRGTPSSHTEEYRTNYYYRRRRSVVRLRVHCRRRRRRQYRGAARVVDRKKKRTRPAGDFVCTPNDGGKKREIGKKKLIRK